MAHSQGAYISIYKQHLQDGRCLHNILSHVPGGSLGQGHQMAGEGARLTLLSLQLPRQTGRKIPDGVNICKGSEADGIVV